MLEMSIGVTVPLASVCVSDRSEMSTPDTSSLKSIVTMETGTLFGVEAGIVVTEATEGNIVSTNQVSEAAPTRLPAKS